MVLWLLPLQLRDVPTTQTIMWLMPMSFRNVPGCLLRVLCCRDLSQVGGRLVFLRGKLLYIPFLLVHEFRAVLPVDPLIPENPLVR